MLEARGWCKDMDLYTRDGDTVEPLPGIRGPAASHCSGGTPPATSRNDDGESRFDLPSVRAFAGC